MSSKKLAEKILNNLKNKGYIDQKDSIKKIEEIAKEEERDESDIVKELIGHLIDLSEDIGVQQKLCQIRQNKHFRWDKRLELLMIWIALDPSIQKSLDPKDII